jgi:hypothetical protein
MWTTFWLNNFNFAMQFFGAVILFALAWLAFDAYMIKKEFKTLARSLGFFFFAIWQIIMALNIANDLLLLLGAIFYIAGLFLIFFNLYSEKPLVRPQFAIILVLPAIASILWQINIVATLILFTITFLAIKRYTQESQKTLKPFWLAFSFLTLASLLSIFETKSGAGINSPFWIPEHLIKFVGFCSLAVWGWQYLKARIKEELLLVFVGMALFIAMIVTFTFSGILLNNMENEAKANLFSNVRVLDYTISRMKTEALSDAQVFSQNKELTANLAAKNFATLEGTAQKLMDEKLMSFLTIADRTGEVVLRAHSLTSKGDSISGEKAGQEALQGNSYVTIEPTASENFSIRGASPIYDAKNSLLGIVITGFIIDNSFVDQIKKSTGLEVTVYQNDAVRATTIFDSEGKTRNVGAKQTDPQIIQKVLNEGKSIVSRTTIFSKPYLAAYFPLKNTEGKIIGMLQASQYQMEIAKTASDTNRLTLLITIIIAIMALIPAYLIVKKISEEE